MFSSSILWVFVFEGCVCFMVAPAVYVVKDVYVL